MQGRMRGSLVGLVCALAIGCRPHTTHEPSADDRARRSALVQSMVDELMKSARVTAIGEGTHGTREFRDALHDATIVALRDHALAVVMLELPGVLGEQLNAAVGSCGPSELPPLPPHDDRRTSMLWTPGFNAFLATVREHNAAHPDRCVRLVGVDPHGGPGATTGLYALAAPYLTEPANRRLAASLRSHAGLQLERDANDHDARARAARDLELAKAVLDDPHSWNDGAAPDAVGVELPFWLGLSAQRLGMLDGWAQRERFMADNVLFWARIVPADRALILYAHAFHVAAAPYTFKGRAHTTMGTFVRETLGDDYRVAALAFGAGTFLAAQPIGARARGVHVARIDPPSQPCLEGSLLGRGDADFVLAPQSDCPALGSACRAMRMFGIAYPIGFHDMKLDYVGVDVARAFDRVVFFPHASADR